MRGDNGVERGKLRVSSLLEKAETASTPEELASIQKELANAHKRSGVKGKLLAGLNVQNMAFNSLASLLSGDKNVSESAFEKYGSARAIDEQSDAITKALQRAAKRIEHANDELVPLPQGDVSGNPAREAPLVSTQRGGHT